VRRDKAAISFWAQVGPGNCSKRRQVAQKSRGSSGTSFIELGPNAEWLNRPKTAVRQELENQQDLATTGHCRMALIRQFESSTAHHRWNVHHKAALGRDGVGEPQFPDRLHVQRPLLIGTVRRPCWLASLIRGAFEAFIDRPESPYKIFRLRNIVLLQSHKHSVFNLKPMCARIFCSSFSIGHACSRQI
jgi:hypothetical protein